MRLGGGGGSILELLAERRIPHPFVPNKMFSSVSGLGVPEAVLRSLAYLKSVILYLWMPCVVLLDLLPCCHMETVPSGVPLTLFLSVCVPLPSCILGEMSQGQKS